MDWLAVVNTAVAFFGLMLAGAAAWYARAAILLMKEQNREQARRDEEARKRDLEENARLHWIDGIRRRDRFRGIVIESQDVTTPEERRFFEVTRLRGQLNLEDGPGIPGGSRRLR